LGDDKIIDVVVPTILLKKQWEEILAKELPTASVFVIKTYLTLGRKPNLLILDEMHNYAAATYRKVLNSSAQHILGLTATLERKDGYHNLLQFKAPVVYRLPIEKARKLGFVSDYQIYNLGVDFSSLEDQEAYRKAHSSFVGLFQIFDHDFELAMSCLMNNYASLHLVATRKDLPEKDVRTKAIMWRQSMKKRMDILYEAQSKIPVVQDILSRVSGQAIVFTQTVKSCEILTEYLPDAVTYHSQIKGSVVNGKRVSAAKVKESIIQDFEQKSFRTLVGAKALNEGFSVNDIEIAVFFSYTSDIRTFVQRLGRAVRFVPGKKATIVCLYMKPFDYNGKMIHSQELKWLKDAQKSKIGTIEWIDSVDQILNVPVVTF
jgi:superfamily II DNA or RNA helicase